MQNPDIVQEFFNCMDRVSWLAYIDISGSYDDFVGCAGFHKLVLFVAAWGVGCTDELCNLSFCTTGAIFVGISL